MIKKIKEALKQRYNNLGLSDEAFDGVASSVQTIVTEENLDSFVSGAEPLLKQFQSIADKARSQKITTLEDQLRELEKSKSKSEEEDAAKITSESIAEQISAAVTAAMKPLTDEITNLKTINSAKEAIVAAKTKFFGGDYAKKYSEEANDAWDRAVELNDVTGKKMTSDELAEKASGYFNKAVARKGIDTSKPFETTKEDAVPDFSDDVKVLQSAGLLPQNEK